MRKAIAGATATLLALVVIAGPGGAQVAPLGFQIDITEGSPGDTVNGQVAAADVAASCFTTAADLSADVAGAIEVVGDRYVEEVLGGPGNIDFQTVEGAAVLGMGLIVAGLQDPAGEPAGLLFDQSFVMTFADIETQELVGGRGTFDPDSGAGSVVVPDVAPGSWAVAAACIEGKDDANVGADAAMASFVEAIDILEAALIDAGFEDDPLGFIGSPAFEALLNEVGPQLVPLLVTQRALGVQIFCVQNADGVCPGGPPAPGPGPGPSTPTAPPGTPTAPPATPVTGQPTFTG